MVSVKSGLPTYDPGLLRHRAAIQQQSLKRSELGTPEQVWANVRMPRVSVELIGAMGPKEFYQGGQISADSTHLIVMRYQALNIDSSMRVAVNTQIFKIKAVDNVMQMNIWIQLFCRVFNEQSNPDQK